MDPDQLHNILKTIIQQTRVGQLFRHPFNTGIMHASILNAYIRNITFELFRFFGEILIEFQSPLYKNIYVIRLKITLTYQYYLQAYNISCIIKYMCVI